jgi:ABC-type sugar transport system ATPase subunit
MIYEARKICRGFPGVRALKDVSVSFLGGEIHALCGENGAGKSTLMNILSGNLRPDSGMLLRDGDIFELENPGHAFSQGIAIVHQHLSLAENMTVAENIFINRQPAGKLGLIDFRRLHDDTLAWLRSLKISIDPAERIADLNASQKQQVEIAKALAAVKPSFLILDEPTASLGEDEATSLFEVLRDLKDQGVGIIYVSHRLAEIFRIADRVSVLKDGIYQGTWPTSNLTRDELIRRMVGRDLLSLERKSFAHSDVALEVENISGKGFQDVSFRLHRGEVLGLGGLAGAGRSEIARAIFGADSLTGSVKVKGIKAHLHHPADAIAHSIAYVPEERRAMGIFPDASIAENIASSKLYRTPPTWYDWEGLRLAAHDMKSRLKIACTDVNQNISSLSGGNQQKVVLAKWLQMNPDILIVDEPTHGVDIGAKYEIYSILQELAREGKAILLISSELTELISLCDRIIVLKYGRITGELSKEEATEEKIMQLAT